MKSHSVPFAGSIALLVLALLLGGCLSNPAPGGAGTPQESTSPAVPAAGCGFTTCHGSALACGANPPQACTMEYALGDTCRRYAYCDGSGGSCRLVTTTAFDTCRACVSRCGGADPAEVLTCEEKC
jgi:hypothetical protein